MSAALRSWTVRAALVTVLTGSGATQDAPGAASRKADRSIVKLEGPSEAVVFGVPFPLTVERRYPASDSAPPWSPEALAPLDLEERSVDRRRDGDTIVETRRFTARAFARESVEIPEAGFRIPVRSGLPDPPGAVEAPPGVLDRPIDPAPLLLAAALAAAVALAVAGLVRWHRGRPKRLPPPAPPIPPWERALARLAVLRGASPRDEAEVQAFYVEVSAVVRDYVEERFGVRAPEMTTEEFLASPRTLQALTDAHRTLLSDFLLHCDLVKFARRPSSAPERAALCATAERFVQETRVAADEPTRRAAQSPSAVGVAP